MNWLLILVDQERSSVDYLEGVRSPVVPFRLRVCDLQHVAAGRFPHPRAHWSHQNSEEATDNAQPVS